MGEVFEVRVELIFDYNNLSLCHNHWEAHAAVQCLLNMILS